MSYRGWLTLRQRYLALTPVCTLLWVKCLLGKVTLGKCPIEVRLYSQPQALKRGEKRPTHKAYAVPWCPSPAALAQ